MVLIKRKFLLFWMILVPTMAISQERAVLDWNFFKNDRPSNTEHQAYTWCVLSYKYKPTKIDGDVMKIEFSVTNKMDTSKSYFESRLVKSNDLKLLKHEQGHADICFIYAMKLKNIFNTTTFKKNNYKTEIKSIWIKVYAELNAQQSKYDLETNHSKDLENQKKWDLYFREAITLIK